MGKVIKAVDRASSVATSVASTDVDTTDAVTSAGVDVGCGLKDMIDF